ncbi:MAG: nucleotidyltransferase family protein [Chloroflexi bacterium]|nr:MAG: nucleotidyltransferase family protein [Chloroflexota bacterium]
MSPEPIPSRSVAAVLLAAGESRRFGSPKQLARLGGRTLLEHVVRLAARAGLDPIIVVVPVWLSLPTHEQERVTWVRNPHPERGMSFSLQLGFEALPAEAEAAIILLGDQPAIPVSSIAALVARRGPRPIVAGWVGGHPGPPALIERSRFEVVKATSGDRGLRDLLAAHPEWVTLVELPAPADVDTPAALRALRSKR